MSPQTYTEQYEAILNNVRIDTWRWLTSQAKNDTLTFLCYCADRNRDGSDKFCHTRLLIAYMIKRWPEYFIDGTKE